MMLRWNQVGGLVALAALGAACGDAKAPPMDVVASGGINLGNSSGAASEGDETDNLPKLDVGDKSPSTGAGDCPGGGGSSENSFSIIWVANSPEGTVSKIDTATVTELARYRTGPGETPDPSRTTVNLFGDVAVANRSGSVTKIASTEEQCVDANDDGVITTSQGAADILPWGEDECVLWHHDIEFDDSYTSHQGGPRAIAWDAGDLASGACQAKPNLWVGWRDQPNTTVIIRQLNGATGAIEGETTIDEWSGNWGHGTYGGATDADGAFWALGTLGTILRIEPDTFEVERWESPADAVLYGMALDAEGAPWLGGYNGELWKFEPSTGEFINKGAMVGGPTRMRGVAVDSDEQVWVAGNAPCGLIRFDTTTDTMETIDLPDCQDPVGVSIDADGKVWVVDRGAEVAYKVDPTDYSTETVTGLVGPYTYSDMTGAGLGLVTVDPVG